jgi:selenide, water dikinase
MSERARRVMLIGGGHSHVEVLRRFALQPDPSVALTLVSPDPATPYSGMLPGLIAGHYTHDEVHIALAPLARWAGARLVVDRVEALDAYTKTVTLASGRREAFDYLSIDVGSAPDTRTPGALAHALPVKPVARFLAAWARIRADAAAGTVRTIGVVGGGAAGVEVLLAMQWQLTQALGAGAPRFALVTDQPALLPQHPPVVRARFGRLLVERGVVLHLASAAVGVEPGGMLVTEGRRISLDRIVWATTAGAQAWPALAGLACDERGFIRIDDHLRSPSHPFVFAAGDCAAQDGHPRPKSGVFAVRQGPPLAANLRRASQGAPLQAYVPQRNALALITTGDRHAIASRGPFVAEGDWVWRWKDRIDRRFMAKYAVPAPVSDRPAAPAPGPE